MFWDLSKAPGGYPSGRYVVQYDGEGTIEYTPNVHRIETSPGRETLEVDSTAGGIGFFITSVNPSNYLHNIRMRMPSDAPDGEIFNPAFLESIKNYRVIRFILWMAIDGDDTPQGPCLQRRWSDRPKVEDARWSGTHGVPLEMMIALCN